MKSRFYYLDAIRVLACLMVVMMHSPISGVSAEANGIFLSMVSYLTASSVPLFYMVSGALLLPCKEGVSADAYLKKRIGKIIFPTVIFSLFYIFVDNELSIQTLRSVFSIPFNAQGNGILWFMYTLVGLYLLVPIISPWLRAASKSEIELYLVFWLVTLLYPYIGLLLSINTSETGILYYFSGFVGYFLLGYYLKTYGASLKWLVPLALVMMVLPLANKLLNWGLDFYSAFWYLSAPVAIISATWFTVIKRFAPKRDLPVISSVSKMSFGIYLESAELI